MFGALLDRGAGAFRLGPFGINVPSGRIYEPGTNTLVTSWKTPSGWATVREALTMGPRRGEDIVTPQTRPPADEDAEHRAHRAIACVEGSVEIELVCEPGFDYGRVLGEWSLSSDRHRAEVTGAGQTMTLQTDTLLGIEANQVRARHVLREGEEVIAPVLGRGGHPAGERRGSQCPAECHQQVLASLIRCSPRRACPFANVIWIARLKPPAQRD